MKERKKEGRKERLEKLYNISECLNTQGKKKQP